MRSERAAAGRPAQAPHGVDPERIFTWRNRHWSLTVDVRGRDRTLVPKGTPMSTYRSIECATGLKADRALSAAFAQRVGLESSPMNGGHMWLSIALELPME